MACYHPLHAYRSKVLNDSGKRSVTFNPSQGYRDMPVVLPCNQCIGCRLERSRQWAVRCVHEASLHKNNCFITLTYAPENLPADNSLDVTHYQKFMKRLRKRFGANIRFFHCGEYGEKNDRPHYHACLFNFDFPDKTLWKTVRGNRLYISNALSELWTLGYHSIGDVTFESAAYVARYITKKITGPRSLDHYTNYDSRGEIISERRPEYTTMSRRPGIAAGWFEKFHKDVYPSDSVVIREKEIKPPKYYDYLYDQIAPQAAKKVKLLRQELAKAHPENNTHERLEVREHIQLEKFKRLKRSYESET